MFGDGGASVGLPAGSPAESSVNAAAGAGADVPRAAAVEARGAPMDPRARERSMQPAAAAVGARGAPMDYVRAREPSMQPAADHVGARPAKRIAVGSGIFASYRALPESAPQQVPARNEATESSWLDSTEPLADRVARQRESVASSYKELTTTEHTLLALADYFVAGSTSSGFNLTMEHRMVAFLIVDGRYWRAHFKQDGSLLRRTAPRQFLPPWNF